MSEVMGRDEYAHVYSIKRIQKDIKDVCDARTWYIINET